MAWHHLTLSRLLPPPARALRSVNQLLPDGPRSWLKGRGDRAFLMGTQSVEQPTFSNESCPDF